MFNQQHRRTSFGRRIKIDDSDKQEPLYVRRFYDSREGGVFTGSSNELKRNELEDTMPSHAI